MKNSKLKEWAETAASKLNKIAEGTPPDAHTTTREKVVAMRQSILALRPQYSWEAIATMLSSADIDLVVKPSTLRRLVSASGKHRAG